MTLSRRHRRLLPTLATFLVAAAYACTGDDPKPSGPTLPDASLNKADSSAAEASVTPDAESPDTSTPDVVTTEAAPPDSGADVVIVGCVPQEISTRYDAVWLFGTSCRATWDTQNQLSLSDGGVPFSGIEGTISAANPLTGALFAASDGIDIFDGLGSKKNDASLGANVSAAQPVAFIGKPGSASDFYVLTNANASGAGGVGLYHSTLECGNATPVGPPTLIPNTTDYTEAMATVRHANNVDRWVLGVSPGGIAVIPVTASGFGTASVTSLASTLPGITGGQRAFIAFARNRTTFAITAENRGVVTGTFDNATGAISNLKSIPTAATNTLYSAAFSPDATKLYISQWSGSFYQIDLTAAEVDAGDASVDAGASSPIGAATGALRLAIDDKIYLAGSGLPKLTVITNPNAPRASLVVQDVALPSGCTSSYGLPGVGDL